MQPQSSATCAGSCSVSDLLWLVACYYKLTLLPQDLFARESIFLTPESSQLSPIKACSKMIGYFSLLFPLFLALPSPATAGFSCGAKYFIKSANSNLYYTANEISGQLGSIGTHRGWYEQFTVCRDSSWAPQFFVLKSEAISSQYGEDCYVRKHDDNIFYAETGQLTGNHLLEWARSDPYWALVHSETGGYLSAYEQGAVFLGPKNLGWEQALWRES